VSEFVRINQLVEQAHAANVTLKKDDGTPYVHCPITLVEPTKPMGDTLDFSQETIRLRMRHGEDMARAVIQRTGVRPPQPAPSLPTPQHPFPA